ncbi:hypothetical protein BH23ACT10_BH23ACT10_16190 [soil metagenome]
MWALNGLNGNVPAPTIASRAAALEARGGSLS